MRARRTEFPEILQSVNPNELEYIDGWAYAKKSDGEGVSKIYFLSDSQSDINLDKYSDNNGIYKNISVANHIILDIPREYAQKHEEIFKKGIKETAKQLATDGFYEKAVRIIPTTFYAYDKDFINLFAIFYKMSLRKSDLPEEKKEYFEDLRLSTKNKHLAVYQKYKKLENMRNTWLREHH